MSDRPPIFSAQLGRGTVNNHVPVSNQWMCNYGQWPCLISERYLWLLITSFTVISPCFTLSELNVLQGFTVEILSFLSAYSHLLGAKMYMISTMVFTGWKVYVFIQIISITGMINWGNFCGMRLILRGRFTTVMSLNLVLNKFMCILSIASQPLGTKI